MSTEAGTRQLFPVSPGVPLGDDTAHQITPSMAAVGLSVDNPYAESLNRSIKVEEVYLKAYESFAEADSSIKKYIEVYNTKRLHSSLGYVPPVEYEANYQLMNLSKVDTLVVSN